ncbi:MAG: insulinase family protein, partial [Planctomycetes bacterium]|nr:insulinase family protein [Planctomycetota bacterium]
MEGESAPLSDLIIGEHVFERRELANGLRAVAVQEEGDTTTVFMAVAVGTRNETAETTGLAHLTEHAMFAGTPITG